MAYKIVLLGSEGQLGTIISKTLSYNFEIISTSKSGNEFKNIHKLDVTDLSQMKIFMSQYDPDIIINTAAITNVDYCENRKKTLVEESPIFQEYLAKCITVTQPDADASGGTKHDLFSVFSLFFAIAGG